MRTKKREPAIEYGWVATCKLCCSKQRVFLEALKYVVGYRNIDILRLSEKKGFDIKFNHVNISGHFARHTSPELFWKKYGEEFLWVKAEIERDRKEKTEKEKGIY
ncbi:hypothetical protein MUP77_15510 [Candidatus Bathyarchaeota archaeon]|nr:hypothetical protein [Candidatus Bathyarchaeota archaeon]